MDHAEVRLAAPVADVLRAHPAGVEGLAAEPVGPSPCDAGGASAIDDFGQPVRLDRRRQVHRVAEHEIGRPGRARPLDRDRAHDRVAVVLEDPDVLVRVHPETRVAEFETRVEEGQLEDAVCAVRE